MSSDDLTLFTHHPSPEELRSTLGSRYPLWEGLTQFIESHEQITGKWSTWGPANYGWGFRYQRKKKALVALYPGKERFIAQVVLGKALAEQALKLKLGEGSTRRNQTSYGKRSFGKWQCTMERK